MNRSLLVRVCVFLLAVVLLSSPAIAAGGGVVRSEEPGIFAAIRDFLGSLVPSIDKARAGIDPDGDPATDARAGMDPDGAPAPTTDARADIDPDGHP